jgi:hypothetical protein
MASHMGNSTYEQLKGRHVQFRVRDIHHPKPTEVLQTLHGGEVLEGRVVDFSDSGEPGGAFVVIEVGRLRLEGKVVELDAGGDAGRAFVVIEVSGLRQRCVLAVDRLLHRP